MDHEGRIGRGLSVVEDGPAYAEARSYGLALGGGRTRQQGPPAAFTKSQLRTPAAQKQEELRGARPREL